MTATSADAYPLTWPVGWPRKKNWQRERSPYSVSFAKARDDLVRELYLMGSEAIVISTNVPVKDDGLPYASTRKYLNDPGVAVYFYRRKQQQVIACDSWETVHGNLRACGLTIAALRMIDRTGASELLDRAFTGFKALPPATSVEKPNWWNVLDVDSHTSTDKVRAAFKKLAHTHHPDRGGDLGAMARINEAWQACKTERGL